MWKQRNITHPRVMTAGKTDLAALATSVENGSPDALLDTPTSVMADELLGRQATPVGAEHLRDWMRNGRTSTLRVNALSILASRAAAGRDRDDTGAIIDVLETDEQVRVLSTASSLSRVMQYDWPTCRRIAREPATAPEKLKLAKRMAREVTAKRPEVRWCAAHVLKGLVPHL